MFVEERILTLAALAVLFALPTLTAQPDRSTQFLDTAIPAEQPAHTHVQFYGYHLLGDLDNYREDVTKWAEYTNFLSFTTHEIWPRELEGLGPEERKAKFRQAAEKILWVRSLGLDVVIQNVGGPLMRIEESREPWFNWLHDLRDYMGDAMSEIYAFYIFDEPDIRDVTKEEMSVWIDEFKSVFPNVKTVSTYALVRSSVDIDPPGNLDVIAIDPYLNFVGENPAETFTIQYDIRLHQALDWVRKGDRAAFMVGDAHGTRHSNNPMPGRDESLQFYYLTLAEKNFVGLIWWFTGRSLVNEQGNGPAPFELGKYPETEAAHRDIGNALLKPGKYGEALEQSLRRGVEERDAAVQEQVAE